VPVVRACRQEAIRVAKRIVAHDGELVDNRKSLDVTAPALCELPGVSSGSPHRSWRNGRTRPCALRSGIRLASEHLRDTGLIGKMPTAQT
jgi:hypothetical protein